MFVLTGCILQDFRQGYLSPVPEIEYKALCMQNKCSTRTGPSMRPTEVVAMGSRLVEVGVVTTYVFPLSTPIPYCLLDCKKKRGLEKKRKCEGDADAQVHHSPLLHASVLALSSVFSTGSRRNRGWHAHHLVRSGGHFSHTASGIDKSLPFPESCPGFIMDPYDLSSAYVPGPVVIQLRTADQL